MAEVLEICNIAGRIESRTALSSLQYYFIRINLLCDKDRPQSCTSCSVLHYTVLKRGVLLCQTVLFVFCCAALFLPNRDRQTDGQTDIDR